MTENIDLLLQVQLALEAVVDKPSDGNIHAERVSGREFARVGADQEDLLLLLPADSSREFTPVRLSRLTVDFAVSCRVVEGNRTIDETLTIFRVKKPDKIVTQTFCRVVALLLRSMPRFEVEKLSSLVLDLVEFFKGMSAPDHSTILGLWGELFVINYASNPTRLGEHWHITPNDKFDFSLESQRLEVKTTTGPRRHHFSLDQVRQIPGISIIIASVMTHESSDGLTVIELLSRTLDVIKDRRVEEHVRRTALRVIGGAVRLDDLKKYDCESASHSLRFFNASSIPQPVVSGLGVSEVRFVADLQLTTANDLDQVGRWGRLGQALISSKSR